ncbi:hypothetical protein N752_01635 [Desulforamulus aquiferis]|nr:hypothetical protein [Desulforamulus aquiferis]RYD06854.1 hypothetical protein N752_01635 [Desulforamulus aquiferis]
MIITEKLSKEFGTLAAVSNVSIHVQMGDVFGLVGPDGQVKLL